MSKTNVLVMMTDQCRADPLTSAGRDLVFTLNFDLLTNIRVAAGTPDNEQQGPEQPHHCCLGHIP